MELQAANKMAWNELSTHGLDNWTFKWDGGKRRFGLCNHRMQLISMSSALTSMNNEDQFLKVLRHEIAHALVGSGHGHDHAFKAMARSIGGQWETCYNSNKVETVPPTYISDCPKCTRRFKRFRLPRSGRWCKCIGRSNFSSDNALRWKWNSGGYK